MKNLLKLHEAIAVVLLTKPRRESTCAQIAKEINRRALYLRKDRTPVPAYQIMMRTKLNKGRYSHLFKYFGDDQVRLINL